MIYKTIRLYENREDVTLTTLINDHSQEFLGKRKRPAILICPGGGYMVCSEGEGEPVALAFLRMGYQAYVLHYSVYSDPMPTNAPPTMVDGKQVPPAFAAFAPKMEPKERCMFPNPMLDIKKAMEVIRENSDEWLTDPDQIVLCGFSAGAHNAGLYSTYWKRMNMPRPVATILGYGLGDERDNWRENMSDAEIAEQRNISIAMVGTAEPDEETLDKISIVKQISSDTPPMFLWNTSEDQMVMPIQTLKMAEALCRNHVPYEIHTFECGPHGLSTADEVSAIAQSTVREDVGVWMELAHTWLKKRLSIDLPTNSPF